MSKTVRTWKISTISFINCINGRHWNHWSFYWSTNWQFEPANKWLKTRGQTFAWLLEFLVCIIWWEQKSEKLTTRINMSRKQLAIILRNDLMNQANHKTPLLRPITFITSLRRFSFSYTMDLMIMELVYTQDRTINNGNVLDNAMMNLKKNDDGNLWYIIYL